LINFPTQIMSIFHWTSQKKLLFSSSEKKY
jgi:hypothetical protein